MLMDLEPFSLVDYPRHIAATVFFAGCNFRCGYCQNKDLVEAKGKSRTSLFAVLEFLKTRRGLLDGVCLTGGEPLLSADLEPLLKGIEKLGFKIKLDTNGSNLEKLKTVSPFLDYVALDIKASPEKYEALTGKNSWPEVKKTMAWLKTSGLAYEFRTTVLPVWHTFEDLFQIREIIGEDETWILQQFRQPPHGVLDGKTYRAYPDAWLREVAQKLNCRVRGLDL
jgi:pyruvate formate lyase activating enzyme